MQITRSFLKSLIGLGVFVLVAQSAGPALGQTTYFSDDFESYTTDADVTTAGWTIFDTPQVTEVGTTWTVTNPGSRANPPTLDGTPSTGNFMISDSDYGSGDNPTGTGASHDLTTPSFSTVGGSDVWLHIDVSAQLNNNGLAVLDIDVSTDGGSNFTNVFRRVAPARRFSAPTVNNTNADGYYGQLDVDISAEAANESDVMIRFRHYEPEDDWWIAIDNVLVDDVAPALGGMGAIFSEDFSAGSLGAMTVYSTNGNTGNNTWNTADAGSRYVAGAVGERGVNRLMHPTPRGAGGQVQFAIIDPEIAVGTLDEYLKTPVLNLTGSDKVFLHWTDEIIPEYGPAEVLVSTNGGTNWTQVFDYFAGALWNGEEDPFYVERIMEVTLGPDLSQVVFAWHYGGQPSDDHYWAVDDISVTVDPAGSGDLDQDGLTYDEEVGLGTDPWDADTDGDGVSDYDEVWYDGNGAYDPYDPDTNPTGTDLDANEADTDGDGMRDGLELLFGGNPIDENDTPVVPSSSFLGFGLLSLGLLIGGWILLKLRKRQEGIVA